MEKKPWYSSNTVQFFILVFAGGGLDVVTNFINAGDISWQSIALMVVALAGIALRLKTKQAIE